MGTIPKTKRQISKVFRFDKMKEKIEIAFLKNMLGLKNSYSIQIMTFFITGLLPGHCFNLKKNKEISDMGSHVVICVSNLVN